MLCHPSLFLSIYLSAYISIYMHVCLTGLLFVCLNNFLDFSVSQTHSHIPQRSIFYCRSVCLSVSLPHFPFSPYLLFSVYRFSQFRVHYLSSIFPCSFTFLLNFFFHPTSVLFYVDGAPQRRIILCCRHKHGGVGCTRLRPNHIITHAK